MSAMHVEHISVFIGRRPAEVYAFASDPRSLPRWAAGLARSEVRQEGDEWVADSPMGQVRIRFVPKNPYGVLDHDVTSESGVTVHNPMRVVENEGGSEFIFTLFRQPDMSDEKFADDRAAVEKDLQTLKEILERQPPDLHKAPVTCTTIRRMDNVLLVVDDLEAVKAFFIELGLELEGETTVEGPLVGKLIGLTDVRASLVMMRPPDGHGGIELDKFHTPNAVRFGPVDTPVNALGLRRVMFAVDDIDGLVARMRAHGAELIGEMQYEDTYRLAYIRGPEGIIVGLAEDR